MLWFYVFFHKEKEKKKPLQASGLNCDLLQSMLLSIITNPIIPDRLTQL